MQLKGSFVGNGRLLIACAELWRSGGHEVRGVVSACPEVLAWCQAHAISQIPPTHDQLEWLSREPFDYLFSIVNHAITPSEVLETAGRRAINYHDAPLPRYAGFNATAWAVIDGCSTHAVTWHEMSADVDSGPILLQQSIDIREDDTAFSLGAKCIGAGLESFPRLMRLLEAEARDGEPMPVQVQGAQEDFHLRSDRPGQGLIDFGRPAAEIHALIRGLDLGTDDNWMCRAKFAVGARYFVVGEAALLAPLSAEAGCVLSVGESSFDIAAADGVLRLSGLSTLDGGPVAPGALGLQIGQVLPAPPRDIAAAVVALDPAISKHERFWVERLSGLRPPRLLDPTPATDDRDPAFAERTLEPGLVGASLTERASALVAAFAALIARMGDDDSFDLALHKAVPADVAGLYAAATPLRLDVDLDCGFSTLRARAVEELKRQDRRGTYARDVVTRYRDLRDAGSEAPALSIGVRLSSGPVAKAETVLVEGTSLTLVIPDGGEHFAWAYDRRVLSERALEALADRFDALLAGGLATDAVALADIDIIPQAELDLLLGAWQGTAAPYESEICVHDLFEQQAAKTPDATALTFQGHSLTYGELDRRANALAADLRARGVGPEVLVGVCVRRSLEMVVSLLGVLKAGGAYVPLDPVYPRERLGMMLEDSAAKVLVTQRDLRDRLPDHGADIVCIEDVDQTLDAQAPPSAAKPDNLMYVIFTSGSTGRPKGVMVKHSNVANFFAGMDERIGAEPGVWLAVTSISFDISVLELFWTLTRGFEVVIQAESDRASMAGETSVKASSAPMDFGLFYFAADQGGAQPGGAYRLLLEGAKFADTHDFSAVWTPERHFHAFGGLYPNPAVTTAALATITSRVALRAGSIVLPLHEPLRVAEDWSVIDQLSGGRVGLSFASGWHADDFAFMPQNYERRREIMLEHIETVLKLWRGEAIEVTNGLGAPISVKVLPRPIQAAPPMWIASAGSVDTFKLAGRLGANVLTNMLGQDLEDLKVKFAAYREARQAHGHEGPGNVSVMLHTFVCGDTEEARNLARKPFCDYLASSFDLIKMAPSMFPAFKQPSLDPEHATAIDPSSFTDEDMAALLDHAFDRYFETAGLFGTPERALSMVEKLKAIGATEVACLIDFGIDPEIVLQSLPHLDRLRQLSNPGVDAAADAGAFSIGDQLRDRRVTHLQCTPSMARMIASDEAALSGLGGLKRLMLGGEALPSDLVDQLLPSVGGEIMNMYGPTETTIWSTTAPVKAGQPITIGRPIANTVIRILDPRGRLAPIGVAGELCIGGAGVVRGYFGRPDLTAERFVNDPCADGQTIYRTGDLARYRDTGEIEFLGRLDHQVKVNGYRIELGEIETVLGRHPAVRQNVVVARSDDGPAQLVAYVVTTGAAARDADDGERVAQWQGLWDETYRQAGGDFEPRFNIAGWNDSYTGAPIPTEEMREWLDEVERNVLSLTPSRVLEIGCGTGMVLYRVAPHAEHYTACDVSPHALETIRSELTDEEAMKVVLLQQPAHALDGVAERSCDTVVINSVAQYFPDGDYLARVLKRASEVVADGGCIFLGDVRSRDHQDAFHTVAALNQAPGHLDATELVRRIDKRIAQDGELVLSEAFFHALARDLPRVSGVEVRLKRAKAHNEMSAFRYDIVLHVGPPCVELGTKPPPPTTASTYAEIDQALAGEPPVVVLENLKNARLSAVYAVRDVMASPSAPDAAGLRRMLDAEAGVDPAELVARYPAYEVDLYWAGSGDPRCFDAVLRHKTHGPKARLQRVAPRADMAPAAYASTPFRSEEAAALAGDLRAHLREFLPEYMTPAAFVLMDALPLTPNGKIDRKALPAPVAAGPKSSVEYVAPSNDLEETIAGVWKALLNLDRVGLRDNIFDLGANSLLTAQANSNLSAILGRKVSLVSMFRFPTVESLAAHLDDNQASPELALKRTQERTDRKSDAAGRRRELRQAMASR